MVSKLYRWLRLPPQDVYHMVLHVRDAERYSIILEVLDDVVLENQNAEWIQSRSTLLEEKTVFKICFLEDVLSITNVLCLVLQTSKKDFGAISRAVSNCIKMLEEILTNKNTDLLKSFNSSCADIVKKIDDYQMWLTVSGSTRKKRAEDRFSNDKDQFMR